MRHERILHFLTTIAAAAALAGCNGASATPDRSAPVSRAGATAENGPATTWEVATVTTRPYIEQVDLPGASVRGFETTRLMAKVGGYVGEIGTVGGKEVDIGTPVKQGTVLAKLDIPEMADELREKQAFVARAVSEVAQAEAAVQQARAAVTQAQAAVKEAHALRAEKTALLKLQTTKLARIKGLVAAGSVNTLSRDEAQYAVDAAKAALISVAATVTTAEANVTAALADIKKSEADKAAAEDRVKVARAQFDRVTTLADYATLRAPFDGIVTKRLVDHRAFVRPATSNSGAMPLFEVTRTDHVRVAVSVPSTQAPKIHPGQAVIFHTIGGLPGVTVTGTVSRTAGVLDPKSRMMRIEADFKNPLTNASTGKSIRLTPGMFGTVTVIIKKWKALPIVPTTAVATDENHQPYVMVVEANGRCRRQPIAIAFNDAKSIGISGGLAAGRVVVVRDVARLKEGQLISTTGTPDR